MAESFYNTDNFTVEFCHQFRLDKWDKSREDAIAKAGSQERWAEITRNKYLDPSGNSYCPNFKGQKYCKAYAYFDFTSYCFGDVEMKKHLRNVWERQTVHGNRQLPRQKKNLLAFVRDRNFSI